MSEAIELEAGSDEAASSVEEALVEVTRPRLKVLRIRNFRSIGDTPVEIELDDIVVLVGPNNTGKSSILRAYQVVMSGTTAGKLELEDFPFGTICDTSLPQIELETVVDDTNKPAGQWVDSSGAELIVRERWTWEAPNAAPKKVGWDVAAQDWHATSGPWGATNVANARRPEPHRVDAFDNPESQAAEVTKLLDKALKDRVANLEGSGSAAKYKELLDNITELQKEIVSDAMTEIQQMQSEITGAIERVFPGYVIEFDPRPEDDVEKCVNLFKPDSSLRMGPKDGHLSSIKYQGSGARRTLLWAALRILSELKATNTERPHLLLIDEPELCLHPDAIREACDVLYNLPQSGNWQVMITTHSPVFIDLHRDNTTIVRVERCDDGRVQGTTVYRPERAALAAEDKEQLKLLNMADPYVAEFFFGGRVVLVEGDTEFTAFSYVIGEQRDKFRNVHVVRARGKACLVSLCKILNQFGATYAVVHDSDTPLVTKKDGTQITNPAWTMNENIRQGAKPDTTSPNRLVALTRNFEDAFLSKAPKGDKPYSALQEMIKDSQAFAVVAALLRSLVDFAQPVPAGGVEWNDLNELEAAVALLEQ